MTTREVSINAVAIRAQSKAHHAEQDALILQDDLLIARQQIQELQKQLDDANAKIIELSKEK